MPVSVTEIRASVGPFWQTLTGDQRRLFIGACLAWLFDSFNQQIFNLARDGALEQLLPDARRATEYAPYTTTVLLVAWGIGGLIFGALGDRHGRARILTVCILLYSVSSGLGALSTGMADFCAYRFLSGLGIGGVFGLAVALVADAMPDDRRAPALGALQAVSTWGNLCAALLGMLLSALAARQLLGGLAHWQAMFLMGVLPGAICMSVMRKVREPPRWVASRAESVKRGIRLGSYRSLFTHPRWSKNAWLGLVACSAGIVGLWGVGNFHPKLVGALIEQRGAQAGLDAAGLADTKAYWRCAGLLLQNIGGFLGMLSLAKVAQVVGRRFALALALTLSFLSTVLVFQSMRSLPQMYWMLPIMGFGQLCVFGVFAVYLPELFPTSLRSTGSSFCYNVGRLFAAGAPYFIGQITRQAGGSLEGFRIAGVRVSFVLLLGLIVVPFLPETKHRPLPED